MSLTASAIGEDRHISRKLTINLNHHIVNVRPVIKGKIRNETQYNSY